MKTARTATARTVSNIIRKGNDFLSQTIELDSIDFALFLLFVLTAFIHIVL